MALLEALMIQQLGKRLGWPRNIMHCWTMASLFGQTQHILYELLLNFETLSNHSLHQEKGYLPFWHL
jgi:hypothetical protein